MKKKSYHHGELREALLVEAEKMLVEVGPANLNLRELAKRTGVSSAAPYRHFKSKQELVLGLCEKGFRLLTKVSLDAVKGYPLDPEAQLKEAGAGYVTLAIRHGEILLLMFGGQGQQEEIPEALATASREAFEALTSIIHHGQLKGIFKPHLETEELTISCWSMIHGFATLCRTKGFQQRLPKDEDKIRYWHSLSSQMLNGVLC